jgi:MinD-like ATPase involved in chromosome partitioning or flagellar assembly
MCIAIAAAEYGREVLLIDLDERSSLSFQFMIENPRFTMLEVATNNAALDLSVIRTSERIDFLPAAPRITALDTLEISAIELKNKFSKYELVVIDTPSALNQRSNLAAQISDAVLYPTTDAMIAIRGVLQAHDFYADLQQLGVLPIRQQLNENSSMPALAADFKILEPVIPDDENVSLAQIANKSLMNFAKLSAAADAYRDVTYFLLEELLGGKSNATL